MQSLFNQFENFFNSDPFDSSQSIKPQQFFPYPEQTAGTQDNENYKVTHSKKTLESLGAQVYLPSDEKSLSLSWNDLAGYEEAKQLIEEALLLGFEYPHVYHQVMEKTRASKLQKNETNRPRMILFHGPPGTGKTSSARLIANQIKKPLIYVPTECIVSKWFGESEKNISKVFDMAKELGKIHDGCVIFVDEIDSLASSRDYQTVHEASRRLLSVLLRRLDGFDTQQDKIILICATNREKDLDEAFRSRVDLTIKFPLPDLDARKRIIQRYARHLSDTDLTTVANQSALLSGRNIRDFCQTAERRWVAYLLKTQKKKNEKDLTEVPPPPLKYYIEAATDKQHN